MKKLFAIISILALLLVTTPPINPVQAAEVLDPVCNNKNIRDLPDAEKPVICRDDAAEAQNSENPIFGPRGVITKAVQILAFLVAVASVIVIVLFVGLKLVISGGDPAKVAQARQALVYALVGLVTAGMAQAIVRFILSKL